MHRSVHGSIVDEAHNGLAAPLHEEGWPRRDAIVANKIGRTLSGKHLLLKVIDVDLIVVDRLVCYRVGDGPWRLSAKLGRLAEHSTINRSTVRRNSRDRSLNRRDWHGKLIEPAVGCTLPILG